MVVEGPEEPRLEENRDLHAANPPELERRAEIPPPEKLRPPGWGRRFTPHPILKGGGRLAPPGVGRRFLEQPLVPGLTL